MKESGYAGFQMLIDVHLRNRDEPRKICFTYDLDLQNTGPRIVRVRKEKYVFNTPNEEFKYKLLKGGGTVSVIIIHIIFASHGIFVLGGVWQRDAGQSQLENWLERR